MGFKFLTKFYLKHGGLCLALLLLAGQFFPAQVKALSISPVRIEVSGDPGSSQTATFKAYNSEAKSVTYFTNVETFEASDETGNPSFRANKSDLATWISIDQTITLGPYENKENIPFTVNVPAGADPGGYFAVIFLTQNPPSENRGGQVVLGSQVGTLLFFRVNGDIREGADILEFDTKTHAHWFTTLPVSFYYRFQNSGQIWVRPLGDIAVKNIFRHTSKIFPANPTEGNVLPQSIRRFENTWTGPDGLVVPPSQFWAKAAYEWRNFAFGPYTIALNLAYGSPGSLQGAIATTTVWMVPWQLLLIELLALIILFFILKFLIRRYNRWIAKKIQTASRRKTSK